MANRYWVGGTAAWDGTAGTKWATTSGGAGGAAVPTAADDVFLDAASGAVTVTTSNGLAVCRSITCTGFTGTLSLANGSSALLVGDGSGGALLFVAGMTLTNAANSVIAFLSTSNNGGTGWGVTTGGKTLPGLTFNGAGGKWVLQDAVTASGGSATITLTAGTLDTNNQSVTAGTFSSSNSNVRTLTLGTSNVTLTATGGTTWNMATVTNLAVSAASSTITMNGANVNFNYGGGGTAFAQFGTIAFTGSGTATLQVATSFQVTNLTRTGTAAKTDSFSIGANNNNTVIVTGTLTLNSNSDINRLLVQSNVVGTPRTITAANVVITNTVDFMDITGAGAATWTVAGTGATALGDAGGNSGITFTPSATQTHTASAGGNWSDVTKWTSRVPLPQDNVIVDANTTGTLTQDMPRAGADINFTGFTGTFTLSLAQSVFGSWIFASGMTVTAVNFSSTFGGRGMHTVTMAGKSFAGNASFVFQGPGGTYALQDALTVGGSLVVNDGTFDTNNQSVTCGAFTAASTRTTTVNLGTSTVTLTATTASTIVALNAAATTTNGSSATLVISTASANTRTIIAKSGVTFGTVTYTVAASAGSLQFGTSSGSGTFAIGTLNVGSGRGLIFFSGATLTVTNWNVNGTANGFMQLPGLNTDYASAPNSAALQITGDIDLRAKIALTVPPGANYVPVGKSITADLGYALRVNASGTLELDWSANGTTLLTSVSSVADPNAFTGVAHWIRCTLDVDNGAAQKVIKFWTSPDGSTWTQLGATNTTAGTTSIFPSTRLLEIGRTSSIGNFFIGNIYAVQIRNNVLDDGTGIVFDADFTRSLATPGWLDAAKTQFAESSVNAATVTVNGALAQAGDGRVLLTSSTGGSAATITSNNLQSSQYISIQDSTALLGPWYASTYSANVSGNTGWIFTDPPIPPANNNRSGYANNLFIKRIRSARRERVMNSKVPYYSQHRGR